MNEQIGSHARNFDSLKLKVVEGQSARMADLKRISDYLIKDVVGASRNIHTIRASATVSEVVAFLTLHHISSAPIVDASGNLVGSIDFQVRAVLFRRWGCDDAVDFAVVHRLPSARPPANNAVATTVSSLVVPMRAGVVVTGGCGSAWVSLHRRRDRVGEVHS